MNNEELFDREMKALFTQSLEIFNLRYSVTINLGKPKKDIAYLNRYKSIYTATKPSEHFIYFEKLLADKRKWILNTLENDDWLKNGNIIIQFGEGVKGLSEKCKDIKILLSKVYTCALELQESAKKLVSDLSDEYAQNKDLIRPSIILLHLMRIFYAISNDEDKKQLGDIVTTLETDLNIKVKTVKPQFTPSLRGASGFEDIFNIAKTAMKAGGIDLPDEIQAPTNDQFTEVMNTLFSNDSTKSLFQKFAASLQNTDDMGTTMQNLLQTAVDPDTLKNIQSSFLQTAEIAKENSIKK